MAKSTKGPSAAKATSGLAEKNSSMSSELTPERRYHYVEVAAYYLAERRGFDAGSADDDWTQAELQIDRLLAEGQINW